MDYRGCTKQLGEMKNRERSRNRTRDKIIVILVVLLIQTVQISAQETNKDIAGDQDNRQPIKSLFWGSRLVDQQTTATTAKGRFHIEILHRFGTVENGTEDLFGIYAPSNISMSLGYGVNDRLEVAFQTEKNNKAQELGVKYKIIEQSVSDSRPISLSYYLNLSLDAHDSDYFGDSYKFSDRLTYTNQLIASRQFNYKWMTMLSLSYIHINSIDKSVEHDKMELNSSLGYKISSRQSLFISYQLPWDMSIVDENSEATISPKHGVNFGVESTTRAHRFQLFMTTRDNIALGKELIYNQNDISLKNLRLGFNISITLGNKRHNK